MIDLSKQRTSTIPAIGGNVRQTSGYGQELQPGWWNPLQRSQPPRTTTQQTTSGVSQTPWRATAPTNTTPVNTVPNTTPQQTTQGAFSTPQQTTSFNGAAQPRPVATPNNSARYGANNTAQVAQQGSLGATTTTVAPPVAGAFASVPQEMRNNPGMTNDWLRQNYPGVADSFNAMQKNAQTGPRTAGAFGMPSRGTPETMGDKVARNWSVYNNKSNPFSFGVNPSGSRLAGPIGGMKTEGTAPFAANPVSSAGVNADDFAPRRPSTGTTQNALAAFRALGSR